MKRTVLSIIIFLILITPLAVFSQSDAFTCGTTSGFGEDLGAGEYSLDLQCQASFDFSFEIEPDQSIMIEIQMSNYLKATGKEKADFFIHLAMQRARLELREPGSMGVEVMDSGGIIQDIRVSDVSGETYIFEVVNKGFRSAIFDLSVRPSKGGLR
jgi:hypothetical protein